MTAVIIFLCTLWVVVFLAFIALEIYITYGDSDPVVREVLEKNKEKGDEL